MCMYIVYNISYTHIEFGWEGGGEEGGGGGVLGAGS